jgi:preprotein translocase subunit SecE
VARNRKRAKDRRTRRPAAAPVSRPGVATARSEHDQPQERDEVPSPLAHATPDAELADAQLALGRPELAAGEELAEPEDEYASGDQELDADGNGFDGAAGGGGSHGGDLTPSGAGGASVPARQRGSGNRLINFLQGSWRELQRVQWPDRRQVMQATGVVIGFVIVAGVFLGVADTVAGKVVNLILK